MGTMSDANRCDRCGHQLDLLRKPLRQLRWSRHWMQGVRSLFTGPLKVCMQCGAIYTTEGELLAAGAIETATERRLDVYRKDMAYLRDAFGGVVIAAELVALWMAFGTASADMVQVIVAASFGGGMFLPFSYFARKARLARRDLKKLREARRSGEILGPG
jgi:hypothetical protein